MKIKTSELQGAALDWAVAKACNYEFNGHWFKPSTDWSQGGPLIAAHRVEFYAQIDEYTATVASENCQHCLECGCVIEGGVNGPSHLIAACRAIIAAKLGDEVDVPEELV